MKLLVTFCLLLIALSGYTQKYSLYYYENLVGTLSKEYYNALSDKNAWDEYKNNLNDVSEDMEEELKAGSGFSFQEMNQLRALKAKLRKMIDFGYGVAAGTQFKMFNGKMIREIKELFLEISIELLTKNSCVSFYRIRFLNYICLAARQNDRGVVKEITWWNNKGKCNSIEFGGTFTVAPGLYFTFWNNTKCNTYDGSGIFIKSCKFERSWDGAFEPVNTFDD